VLFYGDLGKVEALAYLRVGQPFGGQLQDLSLARAENGYAWASFSFHQVFKNLVGNHGFTLRNQREDADDLGRFHIEVNEAPGSRPKGSSDEQRIDPQAEDYDGDVRNQALKMLYLLSRIFRLIRT
jgi:hypothetical protein